MERVSVPCHTDLSGGDLPPHFMGSVLRRCGACTNFPIPSVVVGCFGGYHCPHCAHCQTHFSVTVQYTNVERPNSQQTCTHHQLNSIFYLLEETNSITACLQWLLVAASAGSNLHECMPSCIYLTFMWVCQAYSGVSFARKNILRHASHTFSGYYQSVESCLPSSDLCNSISVFGLCILYERLSGYFRERIKKLCTYCGVPSALIYGFTIPCWNLFQQ